MAKLIENGPASAGFARSASPAHVCSQRSRRSALSTWLRFRMVVPSTSSAPQATSATTRSSHFAAPTPAIASVRASAPGKRGRPKSHVTSTVPCSGRGNRQRSTCFDTHACAACASAGVLTRSSVSSPFSPMTKRRAICSSLAGQRASARSCARTRSSIAFGEIAPMTCCADATLAYHHNATLTILRTGAPDTQGYALRSESNQLLELQSDQAELDALRVVDLGIYHHVDESVAD